MAEKKFAKLLHLRERPFTAYSNFIRHGYLRHGERGWWGSHSLCYGNYLITSSFDVKYAIAFKYGVRFAVAKKQAKVAGKKLKMR